jgi:SAM-dependent methyltransferase
LVELALRELGRHDLRGVSVLDLGCGYGALSALFATEGATVVGIDVQHDRLEIGGQIARAHGLEVDLRTGRLERPQVTHASFDVALVNNSFCYVLAADARQRTLEEAYRALRPGGVIIVRDPNRLHPRDNFTGLPLVGMLSPRVAGAVSRALGRRRSEVRLRTPGGARRELAHAGFVDPRIAAQDGRLRRTLTGYNVIVAMRPLS